MIFSSQIMKILSYEDTSHVILVPPKHPSKKFNQKGKRIGHVSFTIIWKSKRIKNGRELTTEDNSFQKNINISYVIRPQFKQAQHSRTLIAREKLSDLSFTYHQGHATSRFND